MNEWVDTEEILFKADKKSEKKIRLELGDIIGALYKTHKPLCKNLVKVTFTKIVQSALQQKNNWEFI